MKSPSTTPLRENSRSCRGAIARTLFALMAVLFVALGASAPAGAATPPTIDGNLTDMQQFATDLLNTKTGVGIIANDAAMDVIVQDPKVIPCPTIIGGYFQNGFDQTQYVVAQASNSSDLYLGIRAAGVIGDTDGDGNPDIAGAAAAKCNPLDNVLDFTGIGPGDTYQFLFDTACGSSQFNPTGSITITNDTITGSGVFAGVTGTIAYRGPGGHDLEAKVLNAKLPPAFRVKTFVGSNTDGLSEDVGPQTNIQPNPIVKILKSADPIRVCVGKTTRFTITLQNLGDSDLNSTVVEDDLPPGLTFAGNVTSTCSVGAAQVNGSAITWPAFDLPFGATCTISFDAQAAPECIGLVTNHAKVDAATTGPCVNVPASHDETTFDVTCVSNPCVQVTASGPTSACPGAPVTISGNVTNCSANDETVVVSVNGAQAFSQTVAAKATVKWSFDTTMGTCTAGAQVPFAVHAKATSECGEADADAPTVNVRCNDKPCVQLTSATGPASACAGSDITLAGSVKNCSLDPETIVVTVDGVQALSQLVAGGASADWTLPAKMKACAGHDNVTYAVVATANGQCPPAATDNKTITVACKDVPCVQLTASGPANACAGSDITISGTAKNCSLDPETIVVTVDGVQALSQLVQGGATANWSLPAKMKACTGHDNVTYAVVATANGDCPPAASDNKTVTVQCKDVPCVQLTASGPANACAGSDITISGTAKNCSLDAETIVITVDGAQAFSQSVAGGATANWSFPAKMKACTGHDNVTYAVVATADGDCPPAASDNKTVTVACKDVPCVQLTSATGPASACSGSDITISGTAKNCSLDAETIVITVDGAQAFNQSVAAGASADWSFPTKMKACTGHNNVTYAVVATANGDCPPAATDNKTVTIACKDVPCVQLTAAGPANACAGSDITVSGTAKNCSLDAETIVITVDGTQAFNQSVAGGATANWSFPTKMKTCVGHDNVSYAVIATANGDCPPAASDNKTVTVACKDQPCVTLTAGANPLSACPGDAITVSGTVTNCSLDPETIVVTVNGDQVFNQVVAAGAKAPYTKSTTMPACTSGSQVPFAVVATATNDCNPAGVSKNQTVNVTCNNTPCVQLINVKANLDAACPGAPVTITGTVKNCGTDLATYTVTIAGVQVFTGDLKPGATQDFQGIVNMGQCKAGGQVPFAVHATAHNSCGDAPADAPVSVRCKDVPCVNLTATPAPLSACPGDAITISGNVTNCSLDPETIVVTVNGEQVLNQIVAAGATQAYTKSTTMPACTAGGQVPYAVVATATNDCNPTGVSKSLTVNVTCKNPPCVQLLNVKTDVAAACPNAPVNVSGTVKNCGTDTATYTVTVGGVQVFTGDLAGGATKDFTLQVNMGACKAGGQVPFAVHAAAHNTCGDAAADAPLTVRCKDLPCVNLTGAPDVTAQCPTKPVTISGNVTNCSLDPETIVVTINGDQVLNQLVAAGAAVAYSKTYPMPACDAGSKVPFNVVAVATNDCNPQGVTKNLALVVTCKSGPCVQASAQCVPGAACPGTPISVMGSAKNCSPDVEDITISIDGTPKTFPAVPAGQSVSWARTIVLRPCTNGEQVSYAVIATATNDCGDSQPSNTSCSVTCQLPQVQISKTASPSGAVDQGTKLTYTITVTNPSKTVGLDNVVVTDQLCSDITYQGNATPAPASAPAVGATGSVVWNLGTMAPGQVTTITFDATVITLPAPDCSAKNRSCTNNVSVTANCADAQATAQASYTTPINACPTPGLCRLTGGGCLNEDSGNKGHKQNTFGGNASPLHTGGGPSGNEWEHINRDGKTILFNWHSHDAHVIACSVVPPGPCSPKAPDTRADFVGTGQYSIGSGGRDQDGNMVAYIIDHTEGACNKGVGDYYSIVVRKGLVIGQGDIVFTCAGTIDCGNLQIHPLSPNEVVTPGAANAQPDVQTGLTPSLALLNRAVPNPFTGTTSFAYMVPNGGAMVDIGVYNVAGRLVKTLAQGQQGAGVLSVTWDGSDASGMKMAPGVYFLRSRVGGETNVTRVIYVTR